MSFEIQLTISKGSQHFFVLLIYLYFMWEWGGKKKRIVLFVCEFRFYFFLRFLFGSSCCEGARWKEISKQNVSVCGVMWNGGTRQFIFTKRAMLFDSLSLSFFLVSVCCFLVLFSCYFWEEKISFFFCFLFLRRSYLLLIIIFQISVRVCVCVCTYILEYFFV